jgi:4-aminobutyrate aminotransferase-like enzyme
LGLNSVIQFIPPLSIGDAGVDTFLKALDQVLTGCETT